jgi:hypothetical protein
MAWLMEITERRYGNLDLVCVMVCVQLQLSALNSCPSVVAPANPICPGNDTSGVTFEERVCTCPPQCKAPPGDAGATGVSPAVYGAVGGGGALVVLALAGLIVYCCRRRSKTRKVQNQVSVAVSKSPSSEQSLTKSSPNSTQRDTSEAVSCSVTSGPSSARYGARLSNSRFHGLMFFC